MDFEDEVKQTLFENTLVDALAHLAVVIRELPRDKAAAVPVFLIAAYCESMSQEDRDQFMGLVVSIWRRYVPPQ